MYETLKHAINGEFQSSDSPTTFEDAYNQLFLWVSRLYDMDDFTTSLLRSIKARWDSGLSFEKAFNSAIDEEYDFTDSSYFEPALIKYHETLSDLLLKSLDDRSPSNTWNREINWLASHAIITIDNTDYTLDELRNKLEKEDE